MRSSILATLKFKHPVKRVYVYADGTQETFTDLISLTVMKTGCHVQKVHNSERLYIVHPGWRYIIQSEMKGATI